ncbi:hypothetical protein GJ744_001040 [Endocarpon pusillum]|uniref:Uncharacterized protein n=1 Tax=Endocarpon pusillum TaxID=364733 RepID=A0A8H7ACS1_9EURO|nr:hypothetical protein GJ744_001040 [Endocarpon pusillum]
MNDIEAQASDWLSSESRMQLEDAAIIHLNCGPAETFLPGKPKIRGEACNRTRQPWATTEGRSGRGHEERNLHAAQINRVMIQWHPRNLKWTTRPMYSSSEGSDSVPRKAETHRSTQVELAGEEGYRSCKWKDFRQAEVRHDKGANVYCPLQKTKFDSVASLQMISSMRGTIFGRYG